MDQRTSDLPLRPTDRTRVKRIPQRGRYDRQTIYGILDEALVCHVGFVVDGSPVVIPMVLARDGDRIIIHGSTASRLIRTLSQDGGVDVSVAVTLLDGLVVSRAALDNSMNYRSVVLFGRAFPISDLREKVSALEAVVEHVIPGRWQEARRPNEQELKATTVLALPIEEASAKVRTGPPKDDEDDHVLPIWAGEIPLRLASLPPVSDPQLGDDIPIPRSVRGFREQRVRGC